VGALAVVLAAGGVLAANHVDKSCQNAAASLSGSGNRLQDAIACVRYDRPAITKAELRGQ
jgi:hypothetical protein